MTNYKAAPFAARKSSAPRSRNYGGVRLFSVRMGTGPGIHIQLDPSVLLIFGLVVYSLATAVLPAWHADWTPLQRWITATIAGVLFFASLLAHELAHAVVGSVFRVRVRRITLFLFGGQAEIDNEPTSPNAEFWMAIAGPAMSLAIGLSCAALVSLLAGAATQALLAAGAPAAFSHLPAIPTVLLWLGSVNVMLALFNLVPGFPLDGGRVLRAVLWRLTQNRALATRWAANAGRLFGGLLMAFGIWTFLVDHTPSSLWLVLMGWFLGHLAVTSNLRETAHTSLTGVTVADVMRTRFDTVPDTLGLTDFVADFLMRSTQTLWPVIGNAAVVGTIALPQVIDRDPTARSRLTVGDVMQTLNSANTIAASADGESLLQQLHEPALVIDQGNVVGIAQASDVLQWLAVHAPPGSAP